MKKNLPITFIQTKLVWENKEQNLAHFEECFKAVPKESKLVVMPEMFSTGFSMRPEVFGETMEGETLAWMKVQAKKLKASIVGSVIIAENGKFYNRLLWVKTNGEVEYYDKRHCFRYANEHKYYTGGTKQLIVELEGWKFGCFVCYDLRFPVWCRNKNLKYDAAIFIANWPLARREHWKSLLTARAIENQSYVIGVNRLGKDQKGIEHVGDSVVIDPQGSQISTAFSNDFAVETVVLNATFIKKYRKEFPASMDADEFDLVE